uniref:Uncharacterized protein n=1 Tax=Lepeophtheirus salmonis TaxID=72036 RepID=A0A0K2UB34_LEPSM
MTSWYNIVFVSILTSAKSQITSTTKLNGGDVLLMLVSYFVSHHNYGKSYGLILINLVTQIIYGYNKRVLNY